MFEIENFEIDVLELLENLRNKHKEFLKEVKANPEKYQKVKIQFMMSDKILENLKKDLVSLEEIEKKSIKNYFTIRAITNMISAKELSVQFCPIVEGVQENPMGCWFCAFGHATECHFPYDCDSEYCNHYHSERDITIPGTDGLNSYRNLITNTYESLLKVMNKDAKEMLGDLEYYSHSDAGFFCAICNGLEEKGDPLFPFYSADGKLKICFHKSCLIKKEIPGEKSANIE